MGPSDENRRRFPRVKAPVFFQLTRRRVANRPVVDISEGGVRVYSDDPFTEGDRLTVDLFLPDGAMVEVLTRVAWLAELPPGSPARYDVGLALIDPDPRVVARIERILEPVE